MAAPRTLVKICGVTCEEDALLAARAGADFLGFVFYPPSPRCVKVDRAREIAAAVRRACGPHAPRIVGVTVDLTVEEADRLVERAALDAIQFSGDETAETVAAVRAPMKIRGLSIETFERFDRCEADAWLCDTHAPDVKGGTGRSWNYDALRPYLATRRVLVAGGLRPETVGDVVARLRPWGVDVSSALEAEPGRKNPAAVLAFIAAVRRADATA